MAIPFNSIGETGLKRWNHGEVFEEILPRLTYPQAADVYLEMTTDPVITAILQCSKLLMSGVEWTVVPATDEQVDLANANFLRECMDDMNFSWSEVITDILSYFEYGWSYHEIVYKKREGRSAKRKSNYDDNLIGWHKIEGRSQHSLYGWEFTDEGDILGMYQWQFYKDGSIKLIPKNRALLFRTTAARNNPEGRSFLRGAYRPWYFKKHIEEIEGIGIERDLAGLPVIKLPEDVDMFSSECDENGNPKTPPEALMAKEIVSSIRKDRNMGIVLPSGWDLELLSAQGSKIDTNTIINRHDQRIAITMLADIVMLGADKVGSFALAEVKQGLLATSLDAQLKNIANVFNNEAIPMLFDLNPLDTSNGYPVLKAAPVVEKSISDLSDYLKALSASGMPLFPDEELENWFRAAAGMPSRNEDSPTTEQQTVVTPTTTGGE